jgi:hypothetical protein
VRLVRSLKLRDLADRVLIEPTTSSMFHAMEVKNLPGH